MKKLLMLGLVVPMAVLLVFGSVSLAADEADAQKTDLNSDLNERSLTNDRERSETSRSASEELNEDDAGVRVVGQASDLNDRGSVAERRGRQERRGQSAEQVSEPQGWWDHKSGKSSDGGDEGDDEDEDGDQSPYGN